MASNNDLNMLLKAQVVKIRAELDLPGSLPTIEKQVGEISEKLKDKPVQLTAEINATVAKLNEGIESIQEKIRNAKTIKKLKIPVEIDVQGSAQRIKSQLEEVHKAISDFNRQYGNHIKKAQEQVNKFNEALGGTGGSGRSSSNSATYQILNEIKQAEAFMKNTYGEGLFGFKELRDAKGNIEGFVAQLEKANGVVHKIRYEWSNNANQFTPINQETVNTVEKHVHRATQQLRTLASEIEKLQSGAGKDALWQTYDELEKRAKMGTLTQDAVKNLQTQIREEQTLQQVINRTNKEYISQQKLIDRINKLKKDMNRVTYREQVDIDEYKELERMLQSINKQTNSQELAQYALRVDQINDAFRDRVRTHRELLSLEKKRGDYLLQIHRLEKKARFDDAFAHQNRELFRQAKLLAESVKHGNEWHKVQRKINEIRLKLLDDEEIQKIMWLERQGERLIEKIRQFGNLSEKELSRYAERLKHAVDSGLKGNVQAVVDDMKSRLDDLKEQAKDLASDFKVLVDYQKGDPKQRRMIEGLRSAIDSRDEEAIKRYINHIYKLNVDTYELTRTIDNAGRAVDRLNIKFAGKGKGIQTAVVDLDLLNNQLRETAVGLSYNANRNLGLIEQLKIALQRVPTWMTAMTAFYGSIRAIRNMSREIFEVDRALTELRRVASSDLNIEAVFRNSVRLAKELGNNVHDVMQTMNDFARTYGEFNERQLLAITNTATLMSNVSELSTQEAGETLIATMNAFNIQAEESIRIVDAFNEVDNNFAVSTQQLAEGMSKTASTAVTFGVTLEESIGHITAISAVTQESGKVIGNSLKTIYSRITTMSDAQKILNSVGVAIKQMGENGEEVRPVQDILADLASVWGDLTDQQRQQIAVTVAGRYQLSRFLALMNNWDMAVKATNTALTSQGSAMRENREYLESFEARINKLKSSFTELSLAVGDAILSDSITLIIDLLNSLSQTAIKVIDTFGALPAVSGIVGSILSAFGMFKGTNEKIIEGIKNSFLEAKNEAVGLTGTMRGLGGVIGNMGRTVVPAFTSVWNGLVKGLKALGSATIYGGIFTAIGWGIEKIIGKFREQKRIQEEIEKSNQTLVESYRRYNRAETTLEDLINKHEELREQVNSGAIKEGTEAYNEYLSINQELAEALPNMVEYIDTKGVAHLKTADAMREELEVAEELSRQYAEDADKNFSKNVKDRLADLDETFDELKDIHKKIKEAEESIESGRESVTHFGRTYSWDVDVEKLEGQIRDLTQQATSHHRQMQEVMNDTMSMITDSAIASLEVSGHLQQMTDSQIVYVEKFSQRYSEVLQGYIDVMKDPEIFNDEEMLQNVIKNFQSVAEHAKEESAKVGEAIHDLMSEMLNGISDPKEIQKIKDNFDLLLNTLPNSFADGIASADEFKKKIKEVLEITQQMDTGAGIDDIAKQLEGYFGSYELARDYVIKLGFAYDNQKIKSEALQKAQEGEIENLETIIDLTVEAIDVTKELFGQDFGESASALKSHIEMLKFLKQVGEEGTEQWKNSINELAQFFMVSEGEIENNFNKYAELIELISDFRISFNDEGKLEEEIKKSYERIKKLAEELGVEIPVNADTQDLQIAQEALEEAKVSAEETKQAIDDNSTAVEILTQKFNKFKEEANTTNKSAWIETVRHQLSTFDGELSVVKDNFGGLKLATADGSESEWLNTLQSQLNEIGAELNLVKDEAGNVKLVLNDATGSTTLAVIEEGAENAKIAISDAIKEHEILEQKVFALPNDYSQINFEELYSGLDTTAEKVQLLSEALRGVEENIQFLETLDTMILNIKDSISNTLSNIKDGLSSIFDSDTGSLDDLKLKAEGASEAVTGLRDLISQLNNKLRDIPLDAFNGLNENIQETFSKISDLMSRIHRLERRIGDLAGTSEDFSLAMNTVNESIQGVIDKFLEYLDNMNKLTNELLRIAELSERGAEAQGTIADSMNSVIGKSNEYGESVSDIARDVARIYAELAVVIADNTVDIIEEYINHGIAIEDLANTAEDSWRDIAETIMRRGDALVSAIENITDNMKDAFKEGMQDIIGLAENLPSQIGRGIRRYVSSATSAMDALASDMVRRFKRELGIHSPSTVFEELGGWVVKGLANGLTGEDLKSLGKQVFKDFGGGIFSSWNMIRSFLTGEWRNISNNTPLNTSYRPVGYEKGGFVNKEHLAFVGEGDRREVIIPLEQNKNRAIDLWIQAGKELGLLLKRNGKGGHGAFMNTGFGALSGESGSTEGGADTGTSGVLRQSIYDGGVDLDGNYRFMAFKTNLEELYQFSQNERLAQAYSHTISMIETRMKAMTEHTLQYRNALKQVIHESQQLASVESKELNRLKDRQKAIEAQLKGLSNISSHTEEQRKEYNELQREYEQNISKIHQLERSIEETNQRIKNTMTEIFVNWVDEIVGKYNDAISAVANKIDDIEFELEVLSLVEPNNVKKELDLLAERARKYAEQQATMRNMVDHLQKEYNNAVQKYGESSEEAQKVKEELDQAKETLEDITLQVLRAEKEIQDTRAKVADRGISQLQNYYGKMKDMALKAIEFEKRELQKAHEEKMKMYDEEIQRINQVYDERLKAMDKEKEEAEYQEQLEEKQKQRAELMAKIASASRDTSPEGRKRLQELQKQLEDLDKEIAKFMRERQEKLLREEIENQRQQQIREIEEQKEREQERYDERVEELDKEAGEITSYYDDLINDEKRWAEMRNDFIKGSFSTLTHELELMSEQLAQLTRGNFDNLTSGFAEMSEEIKKEFAKMFGVDISNLAFNSEGLLDQVYGAQQSKYGVYIGGGYSATNPQETTWKPSSSQPSQGSSQSSQPSNNAKPLKVGGKAKVVAQNAPAYIDSYGRPARPWADQAKYAGVGYSDPLYVVNMNNGYVALAKTSSVYDAIAWVREKDLVGLKTGGYTGDWVGNEGKLALLHKKEIVLNEKQTDHILDTAKIVDRITRILPNIKRPNMLDKFAMAGTIVNNNVEYGDIYVTVENGDKKKARDIANEIIKGIKKRGR